MQVYGDDLAYIHDVGHGDFARQSAPGLLDFLQTHGLTSGLVVDLGCGSGIWAAALDQAGYSVLGIDLSAAMVAIARDRVPQGQFQVGSFLATELPSCAAITAMGECLSYLFDPNNTDEGLLQFFCQVYTALQPGGLFIFDVVAPGRVPGAGPRRTYREGPDWVVLVEAEENLEQQVLTRQITSFRRVGELYHRDYEVHRQRLFQPADLEAPLHQVGFQVKTLTGYGSFLFGPGHFGMLAQKPSPAEASD
ncbi:SAM-dependent methyltransferase [Leptolyngbya sp. 'hensonii']|uniref:class I SAM-dependent DNA methyltransferase n=1 Tax=Leptolyngbya sp. 'hensonii' TaxID=1922337 RepID=UPI00094FBF98|nr:class I SAM-dependent methyltransferase [Leptolyngbya sp. 'hensonii']OLP16551.1 SAM-dependent methyltransferase [Leptolyngbya sp. 'hensonii']